MRFRRIQTRNPPEPHFDRKAMLEVCKPIIPPKEKVCGHLNRVECIYEVKYTIEISVKIYVIITTISQLLLNCIGLSIYSAINI